MTPAFFFSLFLSMMAVCLRAAVIRDISDETLGASAIIERVNANSSKPLVHGDIVPASTRNADPCTAIGCKWPKTGSYVYVPVSIGSEYSDQERNIIINALVTFHASTCIRFVWRTNHVDFIHFFSGQGCYSYVGRQSRGQVISLQRNGCLYQSTVQHEVLHALGFHHEQVRSDRDLYVTILTANIIPGQEKNFVKVATNNLQTPYDFNSVMHYRRDAFSKNGQPTIVAKSNPNLNFGNAFQMSANDIARVNRLYGCCE
ncbi:high choriolytic enzyme 1-like [Pelmatolapia mariae]|uniref:high choriolytic enzyme 1-like n=1 Tax=Pelmatolapia mariae TaxID=158779 RepID=UPI002FE64919